MYDLIVFLVENNLLTVAFIIGAIVFVLAIIGKVKTVLEPSTPMRVVLGVFGLFLMISSVFGYTWSINSTPDPTSIPLFSPIAQDTQDEQPTDDSISPHPLETATSNNVSLVPNTCSQMVESEHRNPILGQAWNFEAIKEDRIIHIWSNHWDHNLTEHKFFLPAGQAVSFESGGGSFWVSKPGCDGVAEVLFQRDTLEEITIEEYKQYIEQQTIQPATTTTTCTGYAFVTQSQVEQLKSIQEVSEAIKKAEEFSGFQQNDYSQGAIIPIDVLIATDLLTTNIEQFGVTPINRQGGWGLFITTREFQAPNAGTYWCVQ